jgi:putative FmdB family regulatory protein
MSPLYEYRCSGCKRVTEIRHGINDEVHPVCPTCEVATGVGPLSDGYTSSWNPQPLERIISVPQRPIIKGG